MLGMSCRGTRIYTHPKMLLGHSTEPATTFDTYAVCKVLRDMVTATTGEADILKQLFSMRPLHRRKLERTYQEKARQQLGREICLLPQGLALEDNDDFLLAAMDAGCVKLPKVIPYCVVISGDVSFACCRPSSD
jgi:hypothetical protein